MKLPVTRRSLLIGAGGAAVSPAVLKAAQGKSGMSIAVIGAGVFGTWTAVHLLRKGHKVVLIDASGPRIPAPPLAENRGSRAALTARTRSTRAWRSTASRNGRHSAPFPGCRFSTNVACCSSSPRKKPTSATALRHTRRWESGPKH